jgi:hypothetical protein
LPEASFGKVDFIAGTIGHLKGSATYDAASLADGAGVTSTATVTGAVLGDFAIGSCSADLQGITTTWYVSAADTVSFRLQNESGGAVDLASLAYVARVIPQAAFGTAMTLNTTV